MTEQQREWADDHGYVHYRCPICGRGFWTDGSPVGECCPDPDSEEDDE